MNAIHFSTKLLVIFMTIIAFLSYQISVFLKSA